ncbi:FMN reductase [Bartonella sp. LJL80]
MSKIIAFSGSTSRPSKTSALLHEIGQKAARHYDAEVTFYDMSDVGPSLGIAQRTCELALGARNIIDELASADALIIGSPVYKGSYPGLFKHFIDLIEPELLYGKPILLAASGGGDRHALMVEHQLRPLFGFFMAHSLPTAIYAAARDFNDSGEIATADLLLRIDKAISQLAPFLPPKAHKPTRFSTHVSGLDASPISVVA